MQKIAFQITTVAISLLFISMIGTSFAQKYSDTFKAQQSVVDHPCLISGDPNMNTMVVQLRSDDEVDGASTDECLEYVDKLIEQGYKVFDVLSWGDNEYTWTLN